MPPALPTASAMCGDECTPLTPLSVLFTALPFIFTFAVISLTVLHRLFPQLCGASRSTTPRKRLSELAFSTTLGATGVLAELVLCEIGGWVDAGVRKLAFRAVIEVLLVCLVVAIPMLEMYSVVEGRWDARRRGVVVVLGFSAWLWVFWTLGDKLPIRSGEMGLWAQNSRSMREECIARVGVVGVSLMALLSGFGCVSTPWTSFVAKPRPVSEIDIARAQAGLEATTELLNSKTAKLRFLEKKMLEKSNSQESLMAKMLSTIRGDADSQEHAILKIELSGLESMRTSLTHELSDLQRRHAFQQRSRSRTGKLLITIYWFFSLYCIYRIAATTFAHLPFPFRNKSSFSQSDPINNVLALLAAYWDPHLDRQAWSRQIGFLLSGVIIAGSLGSVMTTLNMVIRVAPGAVGKGGESANLALFVAQLSAVYVVASALLLRSNLPPSMSTVITQALGAPLDPAFVDRWFDALFLGAAGLTGLTIGVGRRLRGGEGEIRDLEGGGPKES